MNDPTPSELPLLAGLATCLRWLEELVALVSGPLLVAGLGISLVDLLTDGKLLATRPLLLYAWAISQTIGVDAQLVGAFAKARQALRARRYGELAGLLVLGCALAWVGFLAALIFAVGTVWPQVLRGPYVLLVVVTYPLGWALGQLFLALVFFGLITPLALSFRLLRRDSLQRRFQTEATTYWQPRPRGNDLRSYVRQF